MLLILGLLENKIMKYKKPFKSFKQFILEKNLKFKIVNESKYINLIVIDVQPEYENYIPFNITDFTQWLNEVNGQITFLFNGEDTLGMIAQEDLQYWYIENGLNEDVVYNSKWYDKGYAFFRYCMDIGIEEQDIINLVKYMKENNINDSRDIEKELWDDITEKYGMEDTRELMEHADDMIHIPDVMEFLETLGDNFLVVGGGANECLKEIEIALQANNQKFNRIAQWVY